MQKLHDQANEMALYLCSSIERWKLTGFEYQFLQKRRDIDYATRSRHPRREAWLEGHTVPGSAMIACAV